MNAIHGGKCDSFLCLKWVSNFSIFLLRGKTSPYLWYFTGFLVFLFLPSSPPRSCQPQLSIRPSPARPQEELEDGEEQPVLWRAVWDGSTLTHPLSHTHLLSAPGRHKGARLADDAGRVSAVDMMGDRALLVGWDGTRRAPLPLTRKRCPARVLGGGGIAVSLCPYPRLSLLLDCSGPRHRSPDDMAHRSGRSRLAGRSGAARATHGAPVSLNALAAALWFC